MPAARHSAPNAVTPAAAVVCASRIATYGKTDQPIGLLDLCVCVCLCVNGKAELNNILKRKKMNRDTR